MRLLLVNTEPFLPDVIGGGHLSMHQMTLQFLAAGHDCSVVAGIGRHGRAVLSVKRRLTGHPPFVKDQRLGYTTVRAEPGVLPQLLPWFAQKTRADFVSIQGQGRELLAHATVSAGVPTILQPLCKEDVDQLQQTAGRWLEFATILQGPLLKIVSNSHYIARHVEQTMGVDSPVVYPLIRFAEYRVEQRDPKFITFINPHWQKGVEIALRVATMLPNRRFLFVESWPLRTRSYLKLRARLLRRPNVQFRRRSMNMREVYDKTALLLMPSLTQEAFGRVAVEAGLNGIPTIASRVGGIPEAVGKGGILLDPFADPAETWAAEIERVLDDQSLYASLSRAAVANAQREDLDANYIASQFLEIASEHIANNQRREQTSVPQSDPNAARQRLASASTLLTTSPTSAWTTYLGASADTVA